jgi:hypothetical protein
MSVFSASSRSSTGSRGSPQGRRSSRITSLRTPRPRKCSCPRRWRDFCVATSCEAARAERRLALAVWRRSRWLVRASPTAARCRRTWRGWELASTSEVGDAATPDRRASGRAIGSRSKRGRGASGTSCMKGVEEGSACPKTQRLGLSPLGHSVERPITTRICHGSTQKLGSALSVSGRWSRCIALGVSRQPPTDESGASS